MIPEATLIALCSRFQQAPYTLVGDSKQLPPYVGVRDVPKSVALCSQSVLDVAHRMENAPVCKVSTVYRLHAGLMMISSEFFKQTAKRHANGIASKFAVAPQNAQSRGTVRVPQRHRALRALRQICDGFPHSNAIEAKAVRVLVCLLKAKGIPAEDILILAICLYRDQKYLCDRILQDTQVSVATVDSAQGRERSIVIVCTTRTHIDRNSNHTFFADPKRLNVALSRARDGLLLLGCILDLQVVPLYQ
ncbi:unnamed protein product [Heligmosomoides polygyrus]|uniref:AAA_12 domain-containing protein n=1 Tax=Heligmosomoides polygyrus TaxID=6339 RepID=A0A183G4D9_HELPZ|nr:unnamed protein product [Heligmosomoides polygyrus]